MQVVVPHSHDVGLEDFEVFESHLALMKRMNGLSTVSTYRLSPSGECQRTGMQCAASKACASSSGDCDVADLNVIFRVDAEPLSQFWRRPAEHCGAGAPPARI